eukprot:1145557-Pelagomonas_calceolata.AAC.2
MGPDARALLLTGACCARVWCARRPSLTAGCLCKADRGMLCTCMVCKEGSGMLTLADRSIRMLWEQAKHSHMKMLLALNVTTRRQVVTLQYTQPVVTCPPPAELRDPGIVCDPGIAL